jgi:GGDEF domain-containing protein
MESDPNNTYEFLSRAYKVVKIIALSLVSLAGMLVSIVALDIKISRWWVAVNVPLYGVAITFALLVAICGVTVVTLALLLKDGLSALSFFKNKSKNLETVVAQLQDLAYNDPITGIPNSYALRGGLMKGSPPEHMCRCLILLDLQNFGQINKKFNHWVGDEYLRNFSDMVTTSSRRNEFLYKKRPAIEDIKKSERSTDSDAEVKAFRRNSGGDEFFILLEGTIVDGLGYLTRLQKRSGEFEAMALRVLKSKHPFGFHAGLIALGKDETFESADQRVSECLGLAMDKDNTMRLYWNEKEIPRIEPGSFEHKIVEEARKRFAKTPVREGAAV